MEAEGNLKILARLKHFAAERGFRGNIAPLPTADVLSENYMSDEIVVSSELLKEPMSLLEGWVLHETEHRSSYPGTIDRLLLWLHLAIDSGVREPYKLTHLFSDLLITERMLSDGTLSEKYRAYLENAPVKGDYLNNQQAHIRDEIERLLGLEGRPKAEKKAIEAHEALCRRTEDLDLRFRRFSQILARDFLGESIASVEKLPRFQPSFLERDRLIRSLLYIGATPSKIEHFFTRIELSLSDAELRQLLLSVGKLYLYNMFVMVSPTLRGVKPSEHPIYEIWNLGDHPRELSLTDTYRHYGVFIPGVFAIRRREITRGRSAKSLAILMDCSGSTGLNMVLSREREAAFGLIQAAREMDDPISFIPFSTRPIEDYMEILSHNYDTIENAVLQVQPWGYTNLTTPLTLALRVAERVGRQITIVMTDGNIWDSDQAISLAAGLSELGKVVLFLFNPAVEDLSAEMKQFMRLVSIYHCDPKTPFVEDALNEYVL